MEEIIYQIITGVAPFIVELIPSVITPQVKNNVGTYILENIPNGTYTLRVTDGNNCIMEINNIVINTTTTTTTTSTTTTTTTTMYISYLVQFWEYSCIEVEE